MQLQTNPYTVKDYLEMSKWLKDYVKTYNLSIAFLSYKLGLPEFSVCRIKDFRSTGDDEKDLENFMAEAAIMRALKIYVQKLKKGKAKIISTEIDFDYLECEYMIQDKSYRDKEIREEKEIKFLKANKDFKLLGICVGDMNYLEDKKMFLVMPNLAPVGYHRLYLATQYCEYKRYLEQDVRGKRLNPEEQENYRKISKLFSTLK